MRNFIYQHGNSIGDFHGEYIQNSSPPSKCSCEKFAQHAKGLDTFQQKSRVPRLSSLS